ncbi:hypothetical protein F5X98DRAFT_37631 [Xylaria grammica]|nr:hypothetical protein F5X98DRAFT_37631 [Xylaria grammica]
MTDQVSGSSLPQARDLGRQHQEQPQEQPRRHTHLHYRNVHSSHQHNHQHIHHVRSQRDRKVDRRDTSDDGSQNASDVVVIVETISVLQVTDVSGSTIIRTLPHDYSATPVGVTSSSTESIVAGTTDQPSSSTYLQDITSTSSASDDGNGVAGPSSSSSSVVEESTVTPSGSSMPTTFPTLSYAPITSTHLSAAPVFPSISGLSNSTLSSSSSASSNSTVSLHSFTTTASDGNVTVFGESTSSTRSKASLTSSPAFSSSSSSFFSSSSSSSVFTHSALETSTSESSSSVTYSTSTAKPDVTPANGGDGIGSPTDTGSGGDSVSTSASASGSDSGNASAATIAGSVVGAISGLAIILILAAVILRWKKRQSSTKLIQGSGNDRGYGAMTTGGSGGPPTGDGDMSQRRRSVPFAIPAALANLSGHGRFSRSTVSTDGGERGFAKISGRKLPPVIQFGGDGYTDPRATRISDQSIDYRASQNFFGEAPLSRLALGAPMLQETSTPVFHASPARTAVETRGPFSDPFSDDHALDPPTLAPDPVGRSHLPHDRSTRSHVSFSRFTEDI